MCFFVLQVITPSADGPAEKAGIQPRDVVVKIDGKATAGLSLYDAGELLQGAEGSQVHSFHPYVIKQERLLALKGTERWGATGSQVCCTPPPVLNKRGSPFPEGGLQVAPVSGGCAHAPQLLGFLCFVAAQQSLQRR